MSDDDFDRVFGARSRPPITFAERYTPPRAEPPAAPPPIEAPSIDVAYKAYGFLPTGSIGETCDVRRFIDGTDIPEGIEFQYRFLMQVGYVGEEQIRLMLPDCVVCIEGRHLSELRRKLARRQTTFIQQHHSKIWETPSSEVCLVTKIELLTIRG